MADDRVHVTDLAALCAVVRQAVLSASTCDDALRLMEIYAWLRWRNISGVFQDDGLEVALHDRWADTLPQNVAPPGDAVDVLHVATRLGEVGGHSRLLRHLVSGLAPVMGTQAVLLTGSDDPTSMVGLCPVWCLEGTPSERCAGMVAAGRHAGMVVLHIHPDDSAAALAARVLQAAGSKVLFVHHADHVFNLGTGAADAVLEICKTGWQTTERYATVRAQSFLGIPLYRAGDASEDARASALTGPIVSMGGRSKYCPNEALDFPRFLGQLMTAVDNDVVMIGPDGKDPWWAEIRKRYPDRLKFCGFLPPSEVSGWLAKAACYIDSFPLDGGTAYPQAVTAGVPVFGPHRDSALGVSPADALRYSNEQDLCAAVGAYVRTGVYPFDLDAVRQSILAEFSDQAVATRLHAVAGGAPVALPGSLDQLGRRSPEFNQNIWERTGKLRIPKYHWRYLSGQMRRRLALSVLFSRISLKVRRKVLRRIFG